MKTEIENLINEIERRCDIEWAGDYPPTWVANSTVHEVKKLICAFAERVEGKEKILRFALERISLYGDGGICPCGCDIPHIATKALVDYDNAEYKAQTG